MCLLIVNWLIHVGVSWTSLYNQAETALLKLQHFSDVEKCVALLKEDVNNI